MAVVVNVSGDVSTVNVTMGVGAVTVRTVDEIDGEKLVVTSVSTTGTKLVVVTRTVP